MSFTRRGAMRLLVSAMTAGTMAAPAYAEGDSYRQGKIFISTNATDANEVLVYQRSGTGGATLIARAFTEGLGTSAGLGSQGAVTLSRNGRFLFVVNAASNSVTTFAVRDTGLERISVVDSGGIMPTSVTEDRGLVYVLNAGGEGNVAGFRNVAGTLQAIPGSVRGLSVAGGTAPAQVGLNRGGDVLVVTERNTQTLSSWPVLSDGTLGERSSTASPGVTPFGFAFTRRDRLVVSEAAGGATDGSSASSYVFDRRTPTVPITVSAAVSTAQTAACWIAVTPDGRYAYSSNAGSSSVSSFAISRNGALSLLQAQAALTGANAGALDAAVTPDGQQFHIFASRGLQVVSFSIGADGALSPLGTAGGMPAGSAGLAVN